MPAAGTNAGFAAPPLATPIAGVRDIGYTLDTMDLRGSGKPGFRDAGRFRRPNVSGWLQAKFRSWPGTEETMPGKQDRLDASLSRR